MTQNLDKTRPVEIRTPGVVVFGLDACQALPEHLNQLPAGNILIVTDRGLAQAGIAAKICDLLSLTPLTFHVFDTVEPDPSIENVQACLDLADSTQAQIVLGLGGGSSLDVAKVVAVVRGNRGQIRDYVGIDNVPAKGLPTVLMPTTSGTGSEVSPIAVISDTQQHAKLGIVSRHLYCDLAIVDPALTVSCPANVTASCGVDTLTHAVEIYTNKFSVSLVDPLVLEAIRLIGQHLRTCVHYGTDLAARSGMSLAALYGGLGLGPVNTAAVHALAYPLGATFNIPHGIANSLLLPYVMEFNLPANPDKFANIAVALGEDITGLSSSDAAHRSVQAVVQLSRDIGIVSRLRDLEIPADAIDDLAAGAVKVARLLNNNPRAVTVDDARQIYKKAY